MSLKINGSSQAALPATFGAPAYNLKAAGLNGSTTDIRPLLDAAVAAGARHIVIPYSATPWPMTSEWTASGVWLEFEKGARVNLTMTTLAMDLTACRLTNAYLTSPYTGPTSAADNFDSSGSQTYVYDARGVRLRDDCVVENHYQENCATGIEFYGQNIKARNIRFKNIRQYMGWGSAVHSGSDVNGSKMHNCDIEGVYIENADRGCEIEVGSTFNRLVKGYQQNVGPAGYTGQPGAYADYTFILDCHSHQGEGSTRGNVFRDWRLVDCMGGITCVRSNGANDSDLPANNTWENITIEGRVGTSGYESVYIQGYNNKVKNLRLRLGSGVTSKMRVLFADGGGASNEVEVNEASAYALPLVQVGTTNANEDTRVKVARVSAPTVGSGYLVDVYGIRTDIDLALATPVTGTTGYVRLNSPANYSKVRGKYVVSGSETFAQAILVSGAKNAQVVDLEAVTPITTVKDIATSGGLTGLLINGVSIDRSGGVSIDLGGASSYCTVGADVELGDGSISSSGTNNRIPLQGASEYLSTVGDNPLLAALVDSGAGVSLTANEGIAYRFIANRRLSITRFRFRCITAAGNYDVALLDATGKVLWKAGATANVVGVQSRPFSGGTPTTAQNIKWGQVAYILFWGDNASGVYAGLSLASGSGNLFQALKGTPLPALSVTLGSGIPTVGSTVTLGSTLATKVPLVTAHES